MKGFNSIGDLSRLAVLRQGNASLKTRISTLSQELTTGLKADVPSALQGRLTQLSQVQDRLALLDTYSRNAAGVQTELAAMQTTLDRLADTAVKRGTELAATIGSGLSVPQDVLIGRAEQDFRAIVGTVNTSVGGRFLFSGTDVTTAPLSSADDILTAVRAQVADLSDPVQIAAALDEWFMSDDAAGFAATLTHGNDGQRATGVGPDTTVGVSLGVRDPGVRSLLKGLAMAAIAGDQQLGLNPGAKAALLNHAGGALVSAADDLTVAQAGIGMRQQLVEDAATRNAAESAALSIARNDMLAADPYETASALTQAEANLQTLYALTSRLSRLSLTEYL